MVSVNIIVADIGGTNSRLALVNLEGSTSVLQQQHYSNAEFQSFDDVLTQFLSQLESDLQLAALILAVPAPVNAGKARLTNIDWIIDTDTLQQRYKTRVAVINDLEAGALGTLSVEKDQLIRLNECLPMSYGKRVVIGSGTGLGVAWLSVENNLTRSYPTEAGHIDFAAADERQEQLHHFLQKKYGHVSWERILSGPGIIDLYRFCSGQPEADVTAGWVNREASDNDNAPALEAMQLFARIFGAFVGNMVLTHRPVGGIYLVGGVSVKTRKWLQSDAFLQAYFDKGRMRHLAEKTAVFLVPDEDIGLIGIIQYAELIATEIRKEKNTTPPLNIVKSS